MFKSKNPTWALLAIAAFLLASCTNPAAAGEPTVDTNAIFTAAAQTVQVQITQTAAAMPTNTVAPSETPTLTPELPALPSLPPLDVNVTPSVAFTLAPLPGLATATNPAPATTGDKAEWVTQIPTDGTRIEHGTRFDVRWTVRNTGTTTWNTNYTIRHYAGTKLGEKSTYKFRATVKPGDSTDLVIDAVAPSKNGEYNSIWVLTNDQGVNFYVIDVTIKSVNPGPTETPDPTKIALEICCDDDLENDGTRCDDFDYDKCPAD